MTPRRGTQAREMLRGMFRMRFSAESRKNGLFTDEEQSMNVADVSMITEALHAAREWERKQVKP